MPADVYWAYVGSVYFSSQLSHHDQFDLIRFIEGMCEDNTKIRVPYMAWADGHIWNWKFNQMQWTSEPKKLVDWALNKRSSFGQIVASKWAYFLWAVLPLCLSLCASTRAAIFSEMASSSCVLFTNDDAQRNVITVVFLKNRDFEKHDWMRTAKFNSPCNCDIAANRFTCCSHSRPTNTARAFSLPQHTCRVF